MAELGFQSRLNLPYEQARGCAARGNRDGPPGVQQEGGASEPKASDAHGVDSIGER